MAQTYNFYLTADNTAVQITNSANDDVIQIQGSVTISSVTHANGALSPAYLNDEIIITSTNTVPNKKGQSFSCIINDINTINGDDFAATTALTLAQFATLFSQVVGSTVIINGNPNVNISKYGGTTTTLGQKASSASIPTVIASDQSAVSVKGTLVVSNTEITRPADTTAYTALDVIANSTSAATISSFTNVNATAAGSGYITKIRIMTDNYLWGSTNAAVLRLHLFHTAPTMTNDNMPYPLLYANADKRIGSITFNALNTENTSTAGGATQSTAANTIWYGTPLPYQLAAASTTLYGILEVVSFSGTCTPASGQKFFIELTFDNN